MTHKMSGHKLSVLDIFISQLIFFLSIHSIGDNRQFFPLSISTSPEMRQNLPLTLKSEAPKLCFAALSCSEMAHENLKEKLSLTAKGYQ